MENNIFSGFYAFYLHNIPFRQFVTILMYIVLAKLTDIMISSLVSRLNKHSDTPSENRFINLIHAPIFWTVFCFGLLHALIIGPLPEPWSIIAPALTKSTIILIWLAAMVKGVELLVTQRMLEIVARNKLSDHHFSLVKKLIRVILIILGLFWVLNVWNLNLTPFFASAGIAGIAIALAAKDTLANFFGGISMFMDRTYKTGDYIILESGERGEVVDIGMRSTRVMTRDDVMITIPNSIMSTTKIINESAPQPRFRIRIPIGVAYGSDVEQVENLLLKIANANSQVAPNPAARVRMRAFGSSSLDFELLCWVEDPSLKGLVTHQLLKTTYRTFNEENIEIPFQQIDLHVKSK
ncbi:MAG: mechanosensitive ion channel [Desulfobulbaceae bacterium]|nr:mechanosensitive ion channel [Desulfobulbaceae bacterium]